MKTVEEILQDLYRKEVGGKHCKSDSRGEKAVKTEEKCYKREEKKSPEEDER